MGRIDIAKSGRAACLILWLTTCGWTLESHSRDDLPDPSAVVAQVAERLAAYYDRAQRLICTERSTVVPIDEHWTTQGFARTVESELHVDVDAGNGTALPEPRVKRKILRVNGRAPRERDATARAGCTDPPPLATEPLAFLLPSNRDRYRFTAVRKTSERDRPALVIDFTSSQRGELQLVEDELGHDDCFDWKGPLPVSGRLWVDAATHAVLRLERHLAGPTDIRVPRALERKYGFPLWLTIDRDDLWVTFAEVAFTEPAEVLLLPQSIESRTMIRSGLQSTRRTQLFSDYRRFLTEGKVIRAVSGSGSPPSR
jgi:hypothetical protein